MAVENLEQKLEKLVAGKRSNWQSKAKWRSENKEWLKHSRKIAIKVNLTLRERNIKQKDFAELLGVSPQQVCKILKGRENLTLETISKIEKALSINLIFETKKIKKEIKTNSRILFEKTKKINNVFQQEISMRSSDFYKKSSFCYMN